MAEMVDEAAVLVANSAFYDALDNLDLERMDAVLVTLEPVRVVHPGWGMVSGREAVLASWERIFDNAGMMQFTVAEAEAHIDGDFAWVTCVERLTSVQGGQVVEGLVQTTNLFRREATGWRIAHHHGSPVVGR